MCPQFKVTAAAGLVALLTFISPCSAQQGQNKANKFRNRTKSPQVLQQTSQRAAYQRMNQPPELPNLPAFTSGKFTFARSADVGRSNQKAVHLEYAINEPPPSVIAWYESVLRQYGWKVNQKTDYSLYASRPKDGNAVNVFVDNNNTVGYRYRLNIAYKFFRPVEDPLSESSGSGSSSSSSRPPQTQGGTQTQQR
jgi:hypothetical protein